MVKMDIKHQKALYDRNPLIYFLVVFVVSFSALMLSFPTIKPGYSSVWSQICQTCFSPLVNKPSTMRFIEFDQTAPQTGMIKALVVFLDRVNPDDTYTTKNVAISVYNELYVPLAFLIALLLASPVSWKRRLKASAIGIVILVILLFIKSFALVFDNYNYPDFIILKLPIIIKQIVYVVNLFLSITGASTNVIVPIFIWMPLTFKTNDVHLLKRGIFNKPVESFTKE